MVLGYFASHANTTTATITATPRQPTTTTTARTLRPSIIRQCCNPAEQWQQFWPVRSVWGARFESPEAARRRLAAPVAFGDGLVQSARQACLLHFWPPACTCDSFGDHIQRTMTSGGCWQFFKYWILAGQPASQPVSPSRSVLHSNSGAHTRLHGHQLLLDSVARTLAHLRHNQASWTPAVSRRSAVSVARLLRDADVLA